ncbi:MAG: hypothetical protein NDI90_21800, partial [Nitrospira sp. BO4]|nr:hypothetical protein [Nitrospira sp. BO4]
PHSEPYLGVRQNGAEPGCMVLSLSACSTIVDHRLNLLNNFTPDSTTGIEVGKVVSNSGKTIESDMRLETMLQEALRGQLERADLLWHNTFSRKLVCDCKILDYEEGNAFKRILFPGWGATRLTIQCNLHQEGQLVGTIDSKRTIFGGGIDTIGAWRYIFANVAEDLSQNLRQKGFARTD